MSHKKTILILILIIAIFFSYWFFFLSKKNIKEDMKGGNSNIKSQNTGVSQYDKDFVSSLLGLNSVNLDVSILKSPAYAALNYPEIPFVVNYSMESGRNNPFLPVGYDNATVNIPEEQKTVNTSAPASTAATTTTNTSSTTNNNVKPIPKKF